MKKITLSAVAVSCVYSAMVMATPLEGDVLVISPGEKIARKAKEFSIIQQGGKNRGEANHGSATLTVKRFAHADDNVYNNPKAIRAVTIVAPGTSATEWALSGELQSYTDEQSTGNTATSGVAWKYGHGQVFAGHFQALDRTGLPSSLGGSTVGMEINIAASGPDDINARVGLDLIANSYTSDATYGWGMRVRNGIGAFKTGIQVMDHDISMMNIGTPMETGITVSTAGTDGIKVTGTQTRGITIDGEHLAAVRVTGRSHYGMRLLGKYRKAAISIPKGAFVSLDSNNQVKFRYEGNKIQFYAGARKIGYLATGGAGSNACMNCAAK